MSLTKDSGPGPGAARKILQRAAKSLNTALVVIFCKSDNIGNVSTVGLRQLSFTGRTVEWL